MIIDALFQLVKVYHDEYEAEKLGRPMKDLSAFKMQRLLAIFNTFRGTTRIMLKRVLTSEINAHNDTIVTTTAHTNGAPSPRAKQGLAQKMLMGKGAQKAPKSPGPGGSSSSSRTLLSGNATTASKKKLSFQEDFSQDVGKRRNSMAGSSSDGGGSRRNSSTGVGGGGERRSISSVGDITRNLRAIDEKKRLSSSSSSSMLADSVDPLAAEIVHRKAVLRHGSTYFGTAEYSNAGTGSGARIPHQRAGSGGDSEYFSQPTNSVTRQSNKLTLRGQSPLTSHTRVEGVRRVPGEGGGTTLTEAIAMLTDEQLQGIYDHLLSIVTGQSPLQSSRSVLARPSTGSLLPLDDIIPPPSCQGINETAGSTSTHLDI